jgi:hypothetical protein
MNVNRLCGSGLQAIVSASQAILLGDCDIAIGGGAENMSRAPYASLATRFGARMGDAKLIDMMVGALHDPFHTIHMGVTAENVAAKGHHARAGRAGAGKPPARRARLGRGPLPDLPGDAQEPQGRGRLRRRTSTSAPAPSWRTSRR